MSKRQTIAAQVVFSTKVLGLQLLRLLQNARARPGRWPKVDTARVGTRVEVRSRLYVDGRAEERAFELGKVQNLRVASKYLDDVQIPAGELFSFWRQIGRPTTARGFVRGRMLQSGCVVPAIGGGLCQLSNALYQLALSSGCKIVERHPHSTRLPDMPVNDATVAWNYVDLRFRPRSNLRIEVRLNASELIAAFLLDGIPRTAPQPALTVLRDESLAETAMPDTCDTCAEVDCSRHADSHLPLASDVQAFTVDAFWPEFDEYLQLARRECDWLLSPIDGRRWRLPQYAWNQTGFARVKTNAARTLLRSRRMRRLGPHGAVRQAELLRSSAEMANAMASQLPLKASHLVVDQTLLPGLWRSGALGGRTFDVLMRRLPMRQLQIRLDEVASQWPESRTAADFRAPEQWVEAEEEALNSATRIITPHREVAAKFADQAVLLDWIVPKRSRFERQSNGSRPRIFFPGPIVARKGAFVLREALDGVDAELVPAGSELEGENFWGSLRISDSDGIALSDIAAVVQPSYLEERPRALLEAIAAGVPIITTDACGLPVRDGVDIVPLGDVRALKQALLRVLASSSVECTGTGCL